MALQVDCEQLDTFCPRLFRTLVGLGLLPLQLWAKPNEFEKYPRLLFGSVQRYNDVEAGFKEWESRVLRDAPYRKEEYYPELEALRRWMMNNKGIFTKKANQQHLRTSLLARVFQYLYPRYVLANAYCEKHKDRADVLEKFNQFINTKRAEDKQIAQGELEQLLDSTFPDTILGSVQKVKETYSVEWETIIADAKASFIANAAYYRKVLHSEEPVALLESEEQAETEYIEEESA